MIPRTYHVSSGVDLYVDDSGVPILKIDGDPVLDSVELATLRELLQLDEIYL